MINSQEDLVLLIEEVTDIAQSLHWPHRIIDDDDPEITNELIDHLKLPRGLSEKFSYTGICFQPHPSSEWIYLTFFAGRIVMPTAFQFLSLDSKPEHFWGAFTKTQFAGPETHATIVKLLKYLEKKYLQFTSVLDETGYWESDDEQQLVQAFEKMNYIFDVVEEALSSLEVRAADSADTIAAKIEDALRKLQDVLRKREE